MTIQELKAKGSIAVADVIEFKTHADVLRLFGKDQKIIQNASVKHPHLDGVRIWFPMFYDDDNNDWSNTTSKDFERVFEMRKVDNEGYLAELIDTPEWHTRVLFAKIKPANRIFYKFKGVYKLDAEFSREKRMAIYQRIATTAQLYPAD